MLAAIGPKACLRPRTADLRPCVPVLPRSNPPAATMTIIHFPSERRFLPVRVGLRCIPFAGIWLVCRRTYHAGRQIAVVAVPGRRRGSAGASSTIVPQIRDGLPTIICVYVSSVATSAGPPPETVSCCSVVCTDGVVTILPLSDQARSTRCTTMVSPTYSDGSVMGAVFWPSRVTWPATVLAMRDGLNRAGNEFGIRWQGHQDADVSSVPIADVADIDGEGHFVAGAGRSTFGVVLDVYLHHRVGTEPGCDRHVGQYVGNRQRITAERSPASRRRSSLRNGSRPPARPSLAPRCRRVRQPVRPGRSAHRLAGEE